MEAKVLDLKLAPGRLKLAEHERREWVANVEKNVSIEDLEKPDFWSTFSKKLQPYDRIEVRIDTMDWIAEVVVLESGRNWTKCVVLEKYRLSVDLENEQMGTKHTVEYKGPHLKHCIIRKSDGAVIKDGISKKDDAWMELMNLERK